MKCKFYLKSPDGGNNRCLNPSCRLIKCRFTDPQNECECFKPERIEYGSGDVFSGAIELPKYSAKISIGNWEINLTDKTFTEEQIKNMKEMLGWEVKNL